MNPKSILLMSAMLVVFGNACQAAKDGDAHYADGQAFEKENAYAKALRSYGRAAKAYAKDGESRKLIDAKSGWYRAKCVVSDYSDPFPRFRSRVRKAYPWASKDQVDAWLADKTFLTRSLDRGRVFYCFEEVDNLKYRDRAIMDAHTEYRGNTMKPFMEMMLDNFVKADYDDYVLPYDRPKDFLADLQFSVKRSKLPKNGDGIVRIWWPMPIQTACQDSIVEISIEPSTWLKSKTSSDSDIGVAYFEIPIAEIGTELVIRTQIRFRHYQQRFEIDPEQVGEYDKESELYRKYTASSANVAVTPAIEARAKSIVGAEINPYLAAKLLNDYITDNVPYSFPDYNANDAVGLPLSEYVEQHGFGDCGYQSAYFAALCRSVGIPARACGGFQYLAGRPQSHFWSEFYLPEPHDIWIPNDVTVAEMNQQVLGFSEEDCKAFADYFFGQQDPFRMVVQNDIDIDLVPKPEDGRYYFKACLQDPVMLFYESDKNILMTSPDRQFRCYGTYSFNYENAIRARPGDQIRICSSDFGLDAFGEKARFQLRDNLLGKEIDIKLGLVRFEEENRAAVLELPENLAAIAYRPSCVNASKEDPSFSGKWLIVTENP